MTYEGEYNDGNWWSVTMNNMPEQFKFCFVDKDNNWDGENREYKRQGSNIYTEPHSSRVVMSRP